MLATIAVVPIESARADNTLSNIIIAGNFLIDLRLRYEGVEQSSIPKDAAATTLRARLGYQTGQVQGLSALGEFDFVQHFGAEHFNDSVNGFSNYPTVADPDMAALNRIQLNYYTHLLTEGTEPDFKITIGRQRIVFGDGRYIGNADWRQHEQTFDAIMLSEAPFPSLTLSYSYVTRINRVFGPYSPIGHFDSNSHLLNAAYTGLPSLKLEAFAYLLDLRQAPTLSTATYGLRAEETTDLGNGFTARINGAYGHQRGYADNPLSIALSDYLIEGGLGYRGVTGLIGYEVLQGNGTMGFQTPLANLHPFQGWAETFLTKPPNGLRDFYLKAAYGVPAEPLFARVSLALAYHDFDAELVSVGYGSEWDAQLEAQVDRHLTFDAAYANYDGAGPFPNKRVFWLYANYKY